MPAKNDIAPLLSLFRDNANEAPVARYRYLYAECMSASVFEHCKAEYSSGSDKLAGLRDAFLRCFLHDGPDLTLLSALAVP